MKGIQEVSKGGIVLLPCLQKTRASLLPPTLSRNVSTLYGEWIPGTKS